MGTPRRGPSKGNRWLPPISAFMTISSSERKTAFRRSTVHGVPVFMNTWGETVRGLGGFPEGIGGTADHVHLLVALKSKHCLADVMRELKKASSAWVHAEIGQRSFAWHSEALHGRKDMPLSQ